MPISFSDEFHISQTVLATYSTFDPIIDFDTRFFIDPALIDLCEDVEFANAREKITKFFSNIILLLKHSKVTDDMYWKKANRLLTFKEITGTCLGYSKDSTDGNAIGKELRKSILLTIKDFISAGEDAPELFELLGVFQERMGCDRISDLITYILYENILQYTHRIISNLKIQNATITLGQTQYNAVINPYNKRPLLLLPSVILSPLPIAECFGDIDYICGENQRVREELNKFIDPDVSQDFSKTDIRNMLIRNQDFRNAFLSAYKDYPREACDFSQSKSGEYVWYAIAKEFTSQYPLAITPSAKTIEEIETITLSICAQFKKLIENNGLNKLLYNDDKTPKHESAAQLTFLGIADSYCKANNIDLSPETNKGRGPVDFKLSRGYNQKVLVEAKLSSNNQLIHGFDVQLPIYMAQEEVKKAIYLIIDNGHPKKIESFTKRYNQLDVSEKEKILCIFVDGTLKESASTAKK